MDELNLRLTMKPALALSVLDSKRVLAPDHCFLNRDLMSACQYS